MKGYLLLLQAAPYGYILLLMNDIILVEWGNRKDLSLILLQ